MASNCGPAVLQRVALSPSHILTNPPHGLQHPTGRARRGTFSLDQPLAHPLTCRVQRLKSALWYTIGQFVDSSALDSLDADFNATPQFIGALTELVYAHIQNSARDLELFSKHAGRNVITADDVMLLTRRNEALETMLTHELHSMRAADRRAHDDPTAATATATTATATTTTTKRGRPPGTTRAKPKQ